MSLRDSVGIGDIHSWPEDAAVTAVLKANGLTELLDSGVISLDDQLGFGDTMLSHGEWQ
jgi:hypothetical protein